MGKMLDNAGTAQACLQLKLMVHAGMSMGDALAVAADAYGEKWPGPDMKRAAMETKKGAYPDEAMLASGLFPRQACGLVAAGNESGKLEEALASLHAYYGRMDALQRKLRGAVRQPLAMLAMSLAVFALVVVKIMPVFRSVYASMGVEMSGAAGTLLEFGTWLSAAGPTLLWLAIGICAICLCCRAIPQMREAVSATFQRSLSGRWLFGAMDDARFLQALSMGLDSGMVPEESARMALSMQEEGTRSYRKYARCCDALSSGTRLAEALHGCGLVGKAGYVLADTGARAGCEPDAVRNAADMALNDAEAKMDRFSDLIEPALSAFGAALTGLAVLAAMLPLLGVMAAL